MTLRIASAVSAIAAIALVSSAAATPIADHTLKSTTAPAKPEAKQIETAKVDTDRLDANRPDRQVRRIARLHQMIAKHAAANGVPVRLAHAVVTIESSYNPRARGKAGEVGLMQIKPSTARGIGYKGPTQALYDPDTNLRWGMKYLGEAHRLGGGSICGTILKYNAGHYAKRMNKTSANYCSKVKRLLAKS